jgi:phosphoglycerate dehydrogenase-like enzyme
MTDGPAVAVCPEGTRDWVREAVSAGGGKVVEPTSAEALVWTEVADPDGLQAVLKAAPQIRWVQLPWAGIEPYTEAGVLDPERTWTAGKGVYARPVAEHALMLALAGLRDLKRYCTARTWTDQAGVSLIDGRATILGAGGVAEELIALLRPFDTTITVVRRHPSPIEGADRVLEFDERYEALKGADVVFLALALTPETRDLIGEVEFELMEPHAWLVNVARGGHVVTDDLVRALREGAIGGAALDVTNPEPLPAGHPLWDLPNCIITPHTANTEDMAIPLLSERISENVRRFAAGEQLLGLVDHALGY